ncbi:MAG: FAD-dependent oxidoreductase [Methylocystaceae bacterium]
MNAYANLMRPARLGDLTLPNRIVMPAMGTGLANAAGEVTPDLIAHYHQRARGGVGLIVVEITCVDAPIGRAGLNQIRIDHPRYLSGLTSLADQIKAGGARAFIQLHHAGRQTSPQVTEGLQPIAPSPIPCRLMRAMPRAMNLDDINRVKERFVTAAMLAKRSGFDGIELHAAHGYLLSQFLSPYANHRDDEYGGDTERRFRLLREIISGIKETCGNYPLSVRFNMADFVPGGLEPEEGALIARWLDEAGVHLLNISCGNYESGMTSTEPASYPEGWRLYLTEAANRQVKQALVLTGGTIRTPEKADEIIRSGRADLVWLGRPLLADPEWPHKVMNRCESTIRPCLSCNICMQQQLSGLPIRCSVNPQVGRDAWRPQKSQPTRQVLVVGAGPTGMQAAISLTQAGHQVTIIEQQAMIGGLLSAAATPPHKKKIAAFKDYLYQQITDLGVTIRTNTSLTAPLLAELKPEVIILAWGALPFRPAVPGNDVGIDVSTLLTEGTVDGGSMAIVIGGAASGLEAATYLAAQGQKVTVVEATARLGKGLETMTLLTIMRDLKAAGVVMHTSTQVVNISPGEILLENQVGAASTLGYDQLVWATGFRPRPLPPELDNFPGKILVIGDAANGGDLLTGISQADWCKYQV